MSEGSVALREYVLPAPNTHTMTMVERVSASLPRVAVCEHLPDSDPGKGYQRRGCMSLETAGLWTLQEQLSWKSTGDFHLDRKDFVFSVSAQVRRQL